MNTFEQEIELIFSSDNSDEHLRNIWPQDFQYSRLSVCFLSLLAQARAMILQGPPCVSLLVLPTVRFIAAFANLHKSAVIQKRSCKIQP